MEMNELVELDRDTLFVNLFDDLLNASDISKHITQVHHKVIVNREFFNGCQIFAMVDVDSEAISEKQEVEILDGIQVIVELIVAESPAGKALLTMKFQD